MTISSAQDMYRVTVPNETSEGGFIRVCRFNGNAACPLEDCRHCNVPVVTAIDMLADWLEAIESKMKAKK